MKHDVFFVRARAIGDKELLAQSLMLFLSLQRYQACPLSKPGVGFGFEIASTVVPKRDAHGALESSLTALENVSAVEAILKPRARGVSLYERSDNAG